MSGEINQVFGWVWITVGLLIGFILGLNFQKEDWLGGYGSFKRRLIRLGHISFLGLAILNLLFSFTIQNLKLTQNFLSISSWGLIIGAVTMPLCCFITAFKPELRAFFVIPVVSLIFSTILISWGLIK